MNTTHSWKIHMLLLAAVVAAVFPGCQQAPGDGAIGEILEPFRSPTPSQVAREAFNVYDPDLRRRSVALLSASTFGGEEPYVNMYRTLIDDPDPTVRAACTKALGLHGSVEDAKLLIRRMSDEAAFVRWEAASALQKIHDPSAIDPLTNAMRTDEDPDVRAASAAALGQYPQPAVFHALVGALSDSDYSVVAAALSSLQTLTGQSFSSAASQWLTWGERNEGKLFDQQQTYYWQPFQRPRGLVDRVQFWKSYETKPARTPTGQQSGDAATVPNS